MRAISASRVVKLASGLHWAVPSTDNDRAGGGGRGGHCQRVKGLQQWRQRHYRIRKITITENRSNINHDRQRGSRNTLRETTRSTCQRWNLHVTTVNALLEVAYVRLRVSRVLVGASAPVCMQPQDENHSLYCCSSLVVPSTYGL